MKKLLALALILCLCLLPLVSCGGDASGDLEVHFLSVGKADAILLKTKGEAILIDTGYEESYTTIKTALNKEGVVTIDHLILTHFDEDHIGSAARLLGTCPVGTLYMPDYEGQNNEYQTLSAALGSYGGEVKRVQQALTLQLTGFTLTIDPTALTSIAEDEDNNRSLIVSVRSDSFSMLLMGDAKKARVTEYASRDSAHYDVVKLPHHGNYFKDLAGYLDKITPAYAIHSCDAELVEQKLKNACSERGITQFITGDGTVHLTYTIADDVLSVTQD